MAALASIYSAHAFSIVHDAMAARNLRKNPVPDVAGQPLHTALSAVIGCTLRPDNTIRIEAVHAGKVRKLVATVAEWKLVP